MTWLKSVSYPRLGWICFFALSCQCTSGSVALHSLFAVFRSVTQPSCIAPSSSLVPGITVGTRTLYRRRGYPNQSHHEEQRGASHFLPGKHLPDMKYKSALYHPCSRRSQGHEDSIDPRYPCSKATCNFPPEGESRAKSRKQTSGNDLKGEG